MTTETSNKVAKIGKDGVFEDKISNLPDVILSHILSSVSTREAVRTSILSERWNSVWTSVPVINLNKDDIYRNGIQPMIYEDTSRKILKLSFTNFLDKVIVDHKMPYIETITILNSSTKDFSRVKAWIKAAAKRNVQELFLEHSCGSNHIVLLPKALFASEKLVVLKLHVAMMLDVPADSVCFPSLKVLELRNVRYKDDDAAKNLISGCPVLEDLAITRGCFDQLETLTVRSVVLKHLKVSCREGSDDYEKQLVIDAPALESIDIFDCVTDEYEASCDLSSVVKAKLHISNSFSVSEDSESFETSLYELLGKIPNVKWLSFSSYTMQSLSYGESYDMPNFQYLTSFELYALTKVKRISWGLMIEVLYSAPALENITIKGFEFSWEGKSNICHCDVPECLKTSLKTITIMSLTRAYDLRNLTYFLENALVLKRLIFEAVSGVKISRWMLMQSYPGFARLQPRVNLSFARISPCSFNPSLCQFVFC